jgi:hypothetical protein
MLPKSASKHKALALSAQRFSLALGETIKALRVASAVKVAKPSIIDESIIYLKMAGNAKDPRMMDVSFFSPKLRKTDVADATYQIEVGDWDIDKNFNEKRVRISLNRLAVPKMRGDVLEEDHALLEKVIRHLRKLVMNNAITYFELPVDQKRAWKNIVKLDVVRFQDVKVTIEDQAKGGEEQVTATTNLSDFSNHFATKRAPRT